MNKHHPLRSHLRALYFGYTEEALRFQALLFVLDLLVIGFFVVSQFVAAQPWFWIADVCIAAFVALDLCVRLFAMGSLRRLLTHPTTWVDLVVFVTLLLPLHNWGFLRILRLWTLVQSERFWNVLARGRWDNTHAQDLTKSLITLIVFIFLAAGVTQALFLGQHANLNNFVDAIYFVVTSLTTTGYGDIVLDGPWGRVFSIGLMLMGISLFMSIARRVTAPPSQYLRCTCGLARHDLDARCCKSCGVPLSTVGVQPRK